MSGREVIWLAACLLATTSVGFSAPSVASTPSVYLACGVKAVGHPTMDQLLCIAEAIGVPKDPASRVVRHGFNSTFAEPTVEILHYVERKAGILLSAKMELSELDGQLLVYSSAFEALPESLRTSEGLMRSEAIHSSQGTQSLADLCPEEERPLTSSRLQCMARALGIGEGKTGMRIRQDETVDGEPAWTLGNTLEDSRCQAYGEYLQVAVLDARVLRYGLLEAHCAHGPEPKRPILRTVRQQ